MNNLIKVMISTSCSNNRILLIRLCRNADRIRNFNNLSEKTLNKIKNIRKMDFSRIINIRTYGLKVSSGSILPVKENNENKESHYISENEHAHRLLQSSAHYAKTILPPNNCEVIVTNEEAQQILSMDWSMAELHDLVYAFKKLSYNVMSNDTRIDPTNYSNIFNSLHEKIPDLSDELLEEIMKCLIPFHEHTELDLTKTFKLLDKQCALRYLKWPIDKMFLINDIVYHLRMLKASDFTYKLMRKMNSKLNKLTSKNLVQLLFYVNASRKAELNMYEVEVRLEDHIDDLTIHELGIVAMGFFKSKTKIRNSLLFRKIMNRVYCELDKTDTITLAALIKLIRYSMHYNEVTHFRMLLNNITPKLPQIDVMCIAHIAHAVAKAAVYEKPLIDAITERMCNEMEYARIKDIERTAFMLSTFDIDSEHPIYDKIINEITERVNSNKREEILRFPIIFLNLLQYLSIKDIYPIHLLKLLMDPSYIESSYGGNIYRISHGYSIIEHSIKIDCPEYTGPFLDKGVLNTLTKQHQKLVKKQAESSINKLFNEVIYILKETIPNNVDLYIGNLLPNYIQTDAVIGIDESQNYVSIEPFFTQINDKIIKRVDDTFPKNVKWLVFVVIHYNHRIKGTNEPIGQLKAKLRQLKRIGYTPFLITDEDWLRLMNKNEKVEYINNLIKSA